MKKVYFNKKWKTFSILFLLYVIFYSFWLIAYAPGVFSPDSLFSWKSTTNLIFEPGVPISYTLIILLLRKFYNNPIIIPLFQIIMSSFLFSYLATCIKNRFFLLMFFLITISLPSFGFYNVTLWKDVLFSQLVLTLCIFFYRNYKNKKQNSINLFILSFFVAFTSSIRVNGMPYLIIIPFIYFLFKIFNTKKFIKFLFFSFLFYFLIIKIPFWFFTIDNSRNSILKRSLFVQFIASIISENGYINVEDKAILSKIMPLDSYRLRYRCSAAGDYLFFDNNDLNENIFNNEAYIRTFDGLTFKLVSNNLPIIIGNRVCLFSHLIGLGEDRWSYLFVEVPSDISQIGYSYNGNEKIKTVLSRYLFWSKKYPQRIVFWSHWFTLLIYIGFFINAVLKKKKAVLGCLLIVLMNVFVLFFIGVARDYRYLYMLQYCLPFIFVIGLNNKKNEK